MIVIIFLKSPIANKTGVAKLRARQQPQSVSRLNVPQAHR